MSDSNPTQTPFTINNLSPRPYSDLGSSNKALRIDLRGFSKEKRQTAPLPY